MSRHLRRIALAVWCWVFDPFFNAQWSEDMPPVRGWLAERAQVLGFVAHNNRFYNWLDES